MTSKNVYGNVKFKKIKGGYKIVCVISTMKNKIKTHLNVNNGYIR